MQPTARLHLPFLLDLTYGSHQVIIIEEGGLAYAVAEVGSSAASV
jgi:hypothetical protein